MSKNETGDKQGAQQNQNGATTGKPAAKLWGGRFSEATDAFVERFTASVGFDRRLYLADIRGSLAHLSLIHI